MKQGKLTENLLQRSVLREIGIYREELIKGAGIGEDCAFFSWKKPSLAIATETIALPVQDLARLVITAADNNLAAKGVETVAVSLGVTIPADYEEAWLKKFMRDADACCKELSIQISGGDTQISAGISYPVITVTAVGQRAETAENKTTGKKTVHDAAKKEYDIVVSKYIGIEGTAILCQNKRNELLTRYPESFLCRTNEFMEQLSIRREAAIAMKSGVYTMHDIRNGGIFGALWELSRQLDVGLHIDLKKIPVLQETIEVCEFFELNPYQMMSGGALLMLAEDGEALVEALADGGIPATMIGTTHAGNDKVICNGEETRFLDKAAPDELYKIKF